MRNPLASALRKLSTLAPVLAICSNLLAAAPSPAQKMTAEEVVARHLAAIGPADALASTKSIVAIGKCRSYSRMSNVRELTGITQFASEGDKVLLIMLFDSTAYPYEKIGYNGQNQTYSILPDGKRSFLINFLVAQDAPFKQGLIGGVLSTAWPLLNTGAEMPKLSYSGTEKVNNRQAHKLKFDSRRAGGLQINLFFDAETFQHVRTEYQYSISARMGTIAERSVSQLESRYKLVEEFSDFKTEGKLTLPHTYKIRQTIEEQNNTQELEWGLNFSQFAFNEEIDDNVFSVVSGS